MKLFEADTLEKKQNNYLLLPEIQDKFVIRGSCYGWLISVMIYKGTLRTLNPFTMAYFDLPSNDNDDFMAVAIYGDRKRLAFYKLNDERWRDIPTTEDVTNFEDVIFFQEKIYAVDEHSQLYEFDMKKKPLPVGGMREVAPPPYIFDDIFVETLTYVIGCGDGSLLILVRYLGNRPYGYQSYKFDIFTLNKDVEEW